MAASISNHTHCRPHLLGTAPFQGDTVLRLYEQIRDAPVAFPEAPLLSAPLRALLAGLLAKDPEARLGLAQVGTVMAGAALWQRQSQSRQLASCPGSGTSV
jgi:serine/threonine protein kinase